MSLPKPSRANWQADLQLGYRFARGKTLLAHRKHLGPLVVQKPFYPEEAVCHTYLIHPPGGVVGGDQINLSVNVEAQAHCLLTTPGASKYYFALHEPAQLRQHFTVADGACLEWLPQEAIYFNGARVQQQTRIQLQGQAKLAYWEIACLGRLASQETFESGAIKQALEIVRDDRLIFVERNQLLGRQGVFQAMNGFQNKPVYGSFVVTPASDTVLAELASLRQDNHLFSYTLKDQVLVLRFLGDDTRVVQGLFRQAWAILRPHIIGKPACPPRIWLT